MILDRPNAIIGNVLSCRPERAELGIIFLDEIDKIRVNPGIGSLGIGDVAVQQALLKMLEGTTVTLYLELSGSCCGKTRFEIDTSNILFIGSGAFIDLDVQIAERLEKNVISFSCSVHIFKFQKFLFLQNSGRGTSTADDLEKVIAKDLIDYGLIPVTFNFETSGVVVNTKIFFRSLLAGLRFLCHSKSLTLT